jgi:hypothetical protein
MKLGNRKPHQTQKKETVTNEISRARKNRASNSVGNT